jgi:hypothetical protein
LERAIKVSREESTTGQENIKKTSESAADLTATTPEAG